MSVLGIDIGANNVKLVALDSGHDGFGMSQVQVRRHSSTRLEDDLAYCLEYLGRGKVYEAVYVCNSVTGYNATNRAGLRSMNRVLRLTFPAVPVYHLTAGGEAVSLSASEEMAIYSFMGTNFYSSVFLAAKAAGQGVMVDIGTSSTDIIAISGGRPLIQALKSPEYNRLATGELKFSGTLYTPLEYIVQEVPWRGGMTSICPGVAWTGHVYARLGFITPLLMEQSFKTVWGYDDAHERLARYLCYDHELVTENETLEIAGYIRHQQIELAKKSLLQVMEGAGMKISGVPLVALGLGTVPLIMPVAEQLGMKLLRMDELLPQCTVNTLSAVGAAFAGWEHHSGETVSIAQISNTKVLHNDNAYA